MGENTKKFKVVEEIELDGAVQAVDSVVELTEEQAAEFGAKVEAVVDGAGQDSANSQQA